MSSDYPMPSLGSGMVDGTIIEWYVVPGQVVRRGDVVGLVDTEKGAIEIEVWEDAEVLEVLAPPGTKVPVGEPLLRLGTVGEEGDDTVPTEARELADGPEPAEPLTVAPSPPEAALPSTGAEEAGALPATPASRPTSGPSPREGGGAVSPATRQRVSPAARKRAAEQGIALSSLRGSGPGGAITLADVQAAERSMEGAVAGDRPTDADGESSGESRGDSPPEVHRRVTPVARQAAEVLGVDLDRLEGTGPGGAVSRRDVEAAAGPPVPDRAKQEPVGGSAGVSAAEDPGSDEEERHRAMRRAIANAMTRSKQEIPHYYLATSVGVDATLDWLERANSHRAPAERILPIAMYLKSVASALEKYPEFNGFWEHGAFRPGEGIHIGLAISLRRGGLVAPAIHDVGGRSLEEVGAAVVDVVGRARSGRLRGSEVSDATITVTSMGDRGVETVFGVIHPPQVAIVGIGRAVERPWAEGGMLGVRRVLRVTLSADHRASDGHRGGLFLAQVAEFLQNPEVG